MLAIDVRRTLSISSKRSEPGACARPIFPKFDPTIGRNLEGPRELPYRSIYFLCTAAFRRNVMVRTDPSHSSLSTSEHQTQLRRAVLASTIGTAIEWYDFFLYSTVTLSNS